MKPPSVEDSNQAQSALLTKLPTEVLLLMAQAADQEVQCGAIPFAMTCKALFQISVKAKVTMKGGAHTLLGWEPVGEKWCKGCRKMCPTNEGFWFKVCDVVLALMSHASMLSGRLYSPALRFEIHFPLHRIKKRLSRTDFFIADDLLHHSSLVLRMARIRQPQRRLWELRNLITSAERRARPIREAILAG